MTHREIYAAKKGTTFRFPLFFFSLSFPDVYTSFGDVFSVRYRQHTELEHLLRADGQHWRADPQQSRGQATKEMEEEG